MNVSAHFRASAFAFCCTTAASMSCSFERLC
jgi:hypothetical protein